MPDVDLRGAAEMAREVAPGEWFSDSVESEGGHGRFNAYAVFIPGLAEGAPPTSLVDTHNSDNSCIHTDFDGDFVDAWDEHGRRVCEYIAAASPERVLALLDEVERLRSAVSGIGDDFQTSAHHHPKHILIPAEKFEQLCEAARTCGGQS